MVRGGGGVGGRSRYSGGGGLTALLPRQSAHNHSLLTLLDSPLLISRANLCVVECLVSENLSTNVMSRELNNYRITKVSLL